jgi:hypothetical protein
MSNFIPNLNFYVMDANGNQVKRVNQSKYPSRAQWEATLTEREPYQPTKKDLEALENALDDANARHTIDASLLPFFPLEDAWDTPVIGRCKYCVTDEEATKQFSTTFDRIYNESKEIETEKTKQGREGDAAHFMASNKATILNIWNLGFRGMNGKVMKKHPYMN